MTKTRGPWQADDPFDAMAETMRRQTVQIAIDAMKTGIFADVESGRQITCLTAGVLTGLIGSIFSQIVPEGRDAIMEMIADYLPLARENAEELLRENGHE